MGKTIFYWRYKYYFSHVYGVKEIKDYNFEKFDHRGDQKML